MAKSRKTAIRRAAKAIPRAPPSDSTVLLRYVENLSLTPSALAPLQSYVFRINDLFDPNLSGTGHQSYFRDQMFTLYQYGRVLSASIRVTCITDTSQVPMQVVLSPLQSQNGTADTNVNTASERKSAKSTYLNGQMVKTMSLSSTCDAFFGQLAGSTMTDSNYLQSSSFSLSGSNSMWYEFLAFGLSPTTQNVYFKAEIEQVVRFEQPLQQVGS